MISCMNLDVGRVKREAAFARKRVGGGGKRRREFAGGEGIEGAEAGGEIGVGKSALPIKPAEEIFRRACLFLRVAAQAAGDQFCDRNCSRRTRAAQRDRGSESEA